MTGELPKAVQLWHLPTWPIMDLMTVLIRRGYTVKSLTPCPRTGHLRVKLKLGSPDAMHEDAADTILAYKAQREQAAAGAAA